VGRVDFHSQVGDKLLYSCRLIRKINSMTKEGEPLKRIIVVGAQDLLDELDELLWSFSPDEFLPHAQISNDNAYLNPTILMNTYDEVALEKLPHRDVFIYLGQETLEQIHAIVERFERVIEVVSLEENDLHAGRERYKHYRSLGFELQNYDQKGA